MKRDVDAASPTSGVNPHFLANLQAGQGELTVCASQDIYAANGMKLLARGARIDARTSQQLGIHRLLQPLELQLQLDTTQLQASLREGMRQLLASDALLAGWLEQGGRALQRELAVMVLPPLAAQALQVMASRFPDVFTHSLRVAALAWSLAPSPRETQSLLCAGLLHDVGYLYLAPAIWQQAGPLSADAWRQFDAHPLIGFRWASELKAVPADVAQLILQHHERVDGSGYPRQLRGDAVGHCAEVLALAEMVAGIFEHAPQPVGQLQTALKLLPAQFSVAVRVPAQLRAGKLARETGLLQPVDSMQSALHQLLMRFAHVNEVMQHIESQHLGEQGWQLFGHLALRLNGIQRAFNSVGLDMLAKHALEGEDALQMWQELGWVINETNWLGRHLARHLTRQRLHLPPAEAELFEPLAALFLGLTSKTVPVGL
jgi:hypothetical protein